MPDGTPAWYKNSLSVDPEAVYNTPFGKLKGDGSRIGDTDWGQYGKDTATNVASQLPLALMPEASIPMRAISSLLSGFGADQLLNKNKSALDSAMDSGANTTASMLIPGLLENKIGYKNPKVTGTGVAAPFLKALNLMDPSNWNMDPRMMTRPGATQAVPQNLGNIVKDFLTKSSGMPKQLKLGAAGISADDLNKLLKNGAGLGLNQLFDTTLNRPQVPDQ